MSIVKSVLLLLKIDAREDMRAASMTASMSPRRPAANKSRQAGPVSVFKVGKDWQEAKGNLPPVLTVGHELHNKAWVGNVRAAHLSAAHPLTHLRHHTCHFICKKEAVWRPGKTRMWKQGSAKPHVNWEPWRWQSCWEAGVRYHVPRSYDSSRYKRQTLRYLHKMRVGHSTVEPGVMQTLPG